ncbi:MAG: hypothetical protein K2O89_02065 [Clostridia bacterium]|nr:hypothetical protein [Clostridia bacterium]
MKFDVVEVTEDELNNFTAVQMQLLRTAQKNKDELVHKMEKELALFKKLVYTDDMKESSLLAQKQAELQDELDYQLAIIVEQYEYGMNLSEPFIPENPDAEKVGYMVDYSLPYTDRYSIVKEYYLSISDPTERMNLYLADEVAKDYLSSYYRTLLNVLQSYSR